MIPSYCSTCNHPIIWCQKPAGRGWNRPLDALSGTNGFIVVDGDLHIGTMYALHVCAASPPMPEPPAEPVVKDVFTKIDKEWTEPTPVVTPDLPVPHYPLDTEAAIASRIRDARDSLEITQYELADRLTAGGMSISQASISHLERGARMIRSEEETRILAWALDISPKYLLHGVE